MGCFPLQVTRWNRARQLELLSTISPYSLDTQSMHIKWRCIRCFRFKKNTTSAQTPSFGLERCCYSVLWTKHFLEYTSENHTDCRPVCSSKSKNFHFLWQHNNKRSHLRLSLQTQHRKGLSYSTLRVVPTLGRAFVYFNLPFTIHLPVLTE